jgi:hypothetical protein
MSLFVSVLGKIFFVSASVEEAQKSDFCVRNASHFVEVGGANASREFDFLHISVIHGFCEMFGAAQTVECEAIVVCPENDDCSSIFNSCLLLGSYLILRVGMNCEQVLSIFQETIHETSQLQSKATNYADIISKSWKALELAKGWDWLFPPDDSDTEAEAKFDLEMHTHYADEANGSIHTLVPGKLVLFPTPQNLPDGQTWADVSAPDGRTLRRFSAPFIAELLADFDVSAVACLGQTSRASAAAFLARGLDVHSLRLHPRRPSLLSAVDRILALARAAPGAVALFPGGAGGAEWPARVRTLAAAYLVSDFRFDAAAADAWLRMLCPLLAERADRLP